MKKKIISLLTMFCLILPCFFAVACKKNDDGTKTVKAYTYSVVLKNAKGKIDENALQTEYDYKKQEDISWTNSGEDFSLTVTRNTAITDSLSVGLLEGFDYSGLTFKVNSEDAVAEVKSGTKTNCGKDAYLTDREFYYSYENMKKDTELVVDFSACAWAKVSVDFDELYAQGIKRYTVANDFVTINTATKTALTEIPEKSLEVDYGTILAFDCAERLVFKADSSEIFQNLAYAKYASRYYIGSDGNMLQYFTVKQDGECVVYNAVKDYSKRGTLRILDCIDVPVYSSLDNLKNETALSYAIEKELYSGTILDINVVKASKLFMELKGDSKNYYYYVVDSLDGYMASGNIVEEKTMSGTERVYLEVDIDSSAPAKYLVRAPKDEGSYEIGDNYYVVYAYSSSDSVKILNADYVLIGSRNTNRAIPAGSDKNVLFGFSKDKSVEVELSQYTSDIATDFVYKNTQVMITTKNYTSEYNLNRNVGTINEEIDSRSTQITCFSEDDAFKYYEATIRYRAENVLETSLSLDASDFELYDGEKVFYSTNISDPDSWKVLTKDSQLSISSNKTSTIYYYINSSRADAFLQIQNESGEVVSVTNELRDCFGRTMNGSVSVDGFEVDLSRLRYLDIKPINYTSNTAKLLREYDKTYHNISLSGLGGNTLMVSVGGYDAEGLSFKNVNALEKFEIKYDGYGKGGSIYYYFDTEANKHLQLKDSAGNVVSTSTYVMKTPSTKLQINGNYVYCLSLNGSNYKLGEEFYIEIVNATYSLTNDSGEEAIELFKNIEMTESQEFMIEGEEYFFVGERGKDYVIIDSLTNAVIDEIEQVSEIDETSVLYKFTFVFNANSNYASGTSFKLRIKG